MRGDKDEDMNIPMRWYTIYVFINLLVVVVAMPVTLLVAVE